MVGPDRLETHLLEDAGAHGVGQQQLD
jgi:hypothetical protein